MTQKKLHFIYQKSDTFTEHLDLPSFTKGRKWYLFKSSLYKGKLNLPYSHPCLKLLLWVAMEIPFWFHTSGSQESVRSVQGEVSSALNKVCVL